MSRPKVNKEIIKEIFDLTLSFQFKFPEIYENLIETPLFLNYKDEETSEEFSNYHEFLKAQLSIFEKAKEQNRIIIV